MGIVPIGEGYLIGRQRSKQKRNQQAWIIQEHVHSTPSYAKRVSSNPWDLGGGSNFLSTIMVDGSAPCFRLSDGRLSSCAIDFSADHVRKIVLHWLGRQSHPSGHVTVD